jgi:hypothetical protein
MNVEEVGLAALLHDLAEILLWCFAPKLAVEILRYQQTDPTLRSTTAQIQVIGFRLSELQLALCDALHLPELFKTLTGDVLYNETPRVRNVVLAVNLARHSVGSDWNNPALLTDLDAIREFLRVDRRTLLKRLKVPDKMAVKYLSLSRQSPQREEMAVAFDI